MFPGQCGNTAFFFKSQPDQFHFEFRGIVFPGKSFFSAHEVSTCKISGCLSYRILDSGPDGTQTTLTIQESVVQDGSSLGPILLKLRLLAARLGSNDLEEWVKHESEGYPQDAVLPDYRIVGVTYKGTFSGPFGSGIKNAPIPPILIKTFANDSWNNYSVRESIAAVDELVKVSTKGGSLGINASNLILLLQGKIYKGYACNDISGDISVVSLSEISQAVRNRVLELTIEFEKSIPSAAHITFGTQGMDKDNASKAQQITQQIIYGNVGNAISGGSESTINVNIQSHNKDDLLPVD